MRADSEDPIQKAKAQPFKLEDLDPDSQKLKGWRLVKTIHEAAVADERDTYVDPATGYTVFTSRFELSSCQDLPVGRDSVSIEESSEHDLTYIKAIILPPPKLSDKVIFIYGAASSEIASIPK